MITPPTPFFQWVIIALLTTNAFTFSMWRIVSDDLKMVELRSEVAAEQAKQTIEEQKQITEDTTNAWKAALDVTRNDWAKRLRVANVQPMPGISNGTASVNDLPADALPLAAVCAETTEQLLTLQDWIRKQERVK